MAFAIAGARHPKFPTHQPITKSMYFLPRESVAMPPLVAATCSSPGSSLARTGGWRRRAGINDPFRAPLWQRHHCRGSVGVERSEMVTAEPVAQTVHDTPSGELRLGG